MAMEFKRALIKLLLNKKSSINPWFIKLINIQIIGENRNKLKNSDVLSPTFNIVYDYDLGKIKIQHYDLYRLKDYKEILQLGIFETSSNYIKIVEWPEFIEKKPKDRIDIIIKYSKKSDSRIVKIAGLGKWKNYKFDDI